MNIMQQIKLIMRIRADLQKELLRYKDEPPVARADLEEQIAGLEAVIATLTKTNELMNSLELLRYFNR